MSVLKLISRLCQRSQCDFWLSKRGGKREKEGGGREEGREEEEEGGREK